VRVMNIDKLPKIDPTVSSMADCPPSKPVIGFPVTALPLKTQLDVMMQWAHQRLSKVVCVANVHMLIEGHQNPQFASVLRTADMVTPDGMPLVWMLRSMGAVEQDRAAGLDILDGVCKLAVEQNISVFFLGSQSSILEKIRAKLVEDYPGLKIAGMEPLPFRPLTEAEDQAIIQKLNESAAGFVFLSLGCPKQEIWMAAHKDKVSAVMIGLGGAFPVYAGLLKRAPSYIRLAGMEWSYRLLQEPKRLWKRYISTIPLFLWLASKQLFLMRAAKEEHI